MPVLSTMSRTIFDGYFEVALSRVLPFSSVSVAVLWMAIDETPFAADAKIDFADRHRISVAEIPPPSLDVLRLAQRLEHQ